MSSSVDPGEEIDEIQDDVIGESNLLGTDRFENTVIGIIVGWVVKNVFLDPAAITLGGLEWVASTLISSLDSTLRGALGTAGGSIYDAFFGPEGWVTGLQAALVGLATDAGAGAALATGLVNLLLLVAVVGVAFFIARAIAGYVFGGVLS